MVESIVTVVANPFCQRTKSRAIFYPIVKKPSFLFERWLSFFKLDNFSFFVDNQNKGGVIMREAKVYENNRYKCDVRSAENLDQIYDARREWVNGIYHYDQLLNKSQITELLKDHLVAVEGLEEINEEDLMNLLKD